MPVGWVILSFGAWIWLEIGQQVLLIIGIALGYSGLVFLCLEWSAWGQVCKPLCSFAQRFRSGFSQPLVLVLR